MTDVTVALARDWPGKRSDLGEEHPAIWHMLDVAACAERLIDGHGAFAALTNSERRAFVVLAALHDIGKLSETFRALLRDNRSGAYRHWQLSDLLLIDVLDPIIASTYGGDRHARGELYAAVSGHHGGPERTNDRRERWRRSSCIGADAKRAAIDWGSQLLDLFPGGSLERVTQDSARRLSWALSGLTVASDWVASNADWFRPTTPDLTPGKYLARSREQAARALAEAGLKHASAAKGRDACALTGLARLHPMQRAVEQAQLPDGPALALIEDATGAGKTESSLIMAHRMMASGRARGLFFALPTTATANAMFGRMASAASRMFTSAPSVSLSHGRAGLHTQFRALVGAHDDPSPEAGCTRWLADDRRRSLLAEIGVGTIDQALMGILPTRFSTLRLFGLADRVLIVDEAHAYDPFMQRQLETLLRMQAMNGGCAIVMTATLPLRMRQAYVNAFRSGLGHPVALLTSTAYPALSIVGANIHVHPVQPVPSTRRTINIRRIDTIDAAVHHLADSAHAGAACLWVRNAVDEAIAAVESLRARGCSASLLHARFAYGDRLSHEQDAMNRYGRDGHGRADHVLVATQVVEASLDLDFDVMVTDLAPIGSLIQRSGRLWRHMDRRPGSKRPVPGPILTVLSPDPNHIENEHWLDRLLGGGAYVYRHDHQWRTARTLFTAGIIQAPDGLRSLIEAVHGPDPEDVPEPLERKLRDAEGAALAESAQAQHNVVTPEQGYLNGIGGRVWSEEKFPTRLGQPDATLVLARHGPNGLIPWCEADTNALAWARSEVRCSIHRLPDGLPDQSTPVIAQIKADWPRGKRDHLILCPVGNRGEICEGLRYDANWGLLFTS